MGSAPACGAVLWLGAARLPQGSFCLPACLQFNVESYQLRYCHAPVNT